MSQSAEQECPSLTSLVSVLSRFWLGSSPGGDTWCRMVWVVTMELFPWWLLLEDSASLAGCWLYLTPAAQQEGNWLSQMRN